MISVVPSGRFAPSPTGALHLGNLRTALVAWLAARSTGSRFVVRMEDLDRVTSSVAHERAQLADLAAIGLDWDGEVVRQSVRSARYDLAIERLTAAGLTYPCYCTRREIAEAVRAPHPSATGATSTDLRYPGTCRSLGRHERRAIEVTGRRPAIRLRSNGESITFTDRIAGLVTGTVDDVVLRRNDGVAAYNLAVVVDDAAEGVAEVVRADDLLLSSPRQAYLARLLGGPEPIYAHVPLVLGPDGARLAKRDGAVTLADRAGRGESADDVRSLLATSLGLAEPGEPVSMATVLDRAWLRS